MSVDEVDILDSVGFDPLSDNVNLYIFDQLEWFGNAIHISTLENKINRYIDVISSGQLYEISENFAGKSLTIVLIHEFNPDDHALIVLERLAVQLGSVGIGFVHRSLPDGF